MIHIDKSHFHSFNYAIDLGGYRWPPTYSTRSKTTFHFGIFPTFFRVLNFWVHFEALNNVFWVQHSHTIVFSEIVMETCVFLL
jgi:hypothetical protein